jgi:cyclase
MQQIERGIYYEDAYLGVTLGGLVFSHGTIIIDAPLRSEDARSWRSSLLNQRGGANRLLVNLDAHPDRTLGARALDCTILAHQKTAQVFRNRPTIFKGNSIETGSAWEVYSDAIGMRWAVPDITFTQRMSLHWGGPEIILEYHPGPATGAIWVIVPDEKVLFVGDAVVVNQPPFLANADIAEWLQALDLLLADYSDFTIVSGRGGPVAVDAIRTQILFLKTIEEKMGEQGDAKTMPEATEKLIPGLLSKFKFPSEQRLTHTQRLRYGLYQYFVRHYRSADSLEDDTVEISES